MSKSGIASIKVPDGYEQILVNNPTFSKNLGLLLVGLEHNKQKLQEAAEEGGKLLTYLGMPEHFMKWVEKGTIEEVKALLDFLRKDPFSAINIVSDVPDEMLDQVVETLKSNKNVTVSDLRSNAKQTVS